MLASFLKRVLAEMAHAGKKSAKNRSQNVSKVCLKIRVECHKYLSLFLSNSTFFGLVLRMTKKCILASQK